MLNSASLEIITMKSQSKIAFGSFAKQARLAKGLGLRQVAREIGISAAYLSRVENGLEAPSGGLIAHMARLYEIPVEDLTRRATKPKASAAAHGHAMQASPELRALYRLGAQLDSDVIEELIRKVLSERGASEKEIEKQLASLKSELPRVANSTRDELFAAEAKPRFLARGEIARIAEQTLERNGLNHMSYVPPTPIELIVEREPNVLYRIEELKCDKHGNPLVLGLTGWGEGGERQIVVNSVLADSCRKSDECRFNFTLAHELFHATEHLPRIAREVVAPLTRMRLFVDEGYEGPHSAAEKAVSRWARTTKPRRLTTNEDWREWQANTFASTLLMPDWAVRNEFRNRTGVEMIPVESSLSLREVALELADERVFGEDVFEKSLAELFVVSRQAMAIRLLQLNVLQEANG
jgi:transcriptional regulator with XRE-family HTH domain/Zn-dependent peptidase ImmA (M78 family)